jgi:enamine deaminase RidA (YjgF/YER057c/UK114 family)
VKCRLKKYPLSINGVRQEHSDVKSGMLSMSKSIVLGNLIFLSGINCINQEIGQMKSLKLEKQIINCLDNIRLAVEEAGGSMSNLVKLLIMVKNIDDCPLIWETMLAYYRQYVPSLIKEPPAVTIVPVNDFINKGCLVEIDTIAVLCKNSDGSKMRKYPIKHQITPYTYPNINPAIPLLSESVSVGNLLFLSGVAGENQGSGRIETKDFEAQMDIGFEKIMKAFGAAGSSANNIIKTWHLMANVDSMLASSRDNRVSNSPASDRLWKRELEHYEMYAPELLEDFPGSTFLKLKSL